MGHNEPRFVWTSLTTTHKWTRGKRIVCERMVARRSVNHPKPSPKTEPNSADVAGRGVASRPNFKLNLIQQAVCFASSVLLCLRERDSVVYWYSIQ